VGTDEATEHDKFLPPNAEWQKKICQQLSMTHVEDIHYENAGFPLGP